jgi:hypothetical protein
MCVSGLHRSMNAVISGASKLNRVNRSARGTQLVACLPRPTAQQGEVLQLVA